MPTAGRPPTLGSHSGSSNACTLSADHSPGRAQLTSRGHRAGRQSPAMPLPGPRILAVYTTSPAAPAHLDVSPPPPLGRGLVSVSCSKRAGAPQTSCCSGLGPCTSLLLPALTWRSAPYPHPTTVSLSVAPGGPSAATLTCAPSTSPHPAALTHRSCSRAELGQEAQNPRASPAEPPSVLQRPADGCAARC